MRCRSLYEENDHYNLIWFKSKGLKFPKAIFININDSNGIKDIRKSIYSNAEFPLKYEDFEIGNIKFSNFEITKEKNIFDSLIKFDISYSEETNLT